MTELIVKMQLKGDYVSNHTESSKPLQHGPVWLKRSCMLTPWSNPVCDLIHLMAGVVYQLTKIETPGEMWLEVQHE